MGNESFQQELLKPAYIIKTIVRRRWFMILPLMAALAIGCYMAITMPKIYEAETLILIEPQSVPDNYVKSVVSTEVSERINTISQQILSRSNLEKIINQFDLLKNNSNEDVYLEDMVAELRRQIDIDVTRSRRATNSFAIAYRDKSPETAMRVTNALAAIFIEQNLKAREAQAVGTTNFLEAELESMRQRLEAQEDAVRAYRSLYMGELPEQLESNLRILDRLQEQLTERQESLREARSRLALLQSQASVGMLAGQQGGNDGGPAGPDPLDPDALRAELARLQSRYTEKHPDIIKIKKQIKDIEARGTSSTANEPSAPSREPFRIAEIRNEIKNISNDIGRLKSQITYYDNRVEAIPEREQELMALERDYDNLQASYNSLLNRKLEADISVNMERKQKGEQFRVLDPAQLPRRPVEPDMRKVFLITIAAGLALGAGIVLLLEFMNKGFRTLKEMELDLGLPTLAMIPFIETRRTRLLKSLNWVATGFALLATVIMLAMFTSLTLRGVEETLSLLV